MNYWAIGLCVTGLFAACLLWTLAAVHIFDVLGLMP